MLRISDIIRIAKMNEACGVPPGGEGACFGALDPSRMRSLAPIEHSAHEKDGKSVRVCLGYEKDSAIGDVRIVQVDDDTECFKRVIDPETGHIQYQKNSATT